ncbi:MAG TPA: flagellar export chaperone FlgN [Ignavibacteriaceae bacterium]|nr:flagellar export chaperone FlgN [Ignavibacteriaceae bacterium]
MEMINLFDELKKQQELLQKFMDLISLQQKAIIDGDIISLEETLKKESVYFHEIEVNQKMTIETIKKLAEKYSLTLKSNRLSDFLEALEVKKEIKLVSFKKLQTSLKKIISNINNVNNQNKMLISQARNFIKEIIGVLTNTNKSSILDRKV